MSWNIDLTGQVAIVTGGGRGLGLAIAKELTIAGAQVVVADILPEAEIAGNLDALAPLGLRPIHIRMDLSSEEECNALVKKVVDTLGRVDILVNDAALHGGEWQKAFEVNVLAHFYLNSAVYEDMKTRGYGKIVNITTSGTFSGGGGDIKYNATKGAADSLNRYLARRFAADGINVNAIAPGPVLTEMMAKYHGEDVFAEHYIPQMPTRRLLKPIDIAKVALFLCSPLSDALCGETILADGGRVRLNPS